MSKMGRMIFDKSEIKKLYTPDKGSSGEDNGQVTIIGGSHLFHGAPLYGVKIASRIVDMVFFASPEDSVGRVAEQMKSELLSFIWVSWKETEEYIKKSEAILIGPGFMRFKSESIPHGQRLHVCDQACQLTKSITKKFLKEFPNKKWVIDAGSLQTMDPDWIPENSILTPNKKEFEILFGDMDPKEAAKKYKCVVVVKGPTTFVYSKDGAVEVGGGNAGLTKGGTGDVMSGLAVSLLAKNDPVLAATSAAYITKAAGDELYKKVGVNYNADDLADMVPKVLNSLKNN